MVCLMNSYYGIVFFTSGPFGYVFWSQMVHKTLGIGSSWLDFYQSNGPLVAELTTLYSLCSVLFTEVISYVLMGKRTSVHS